MQTKTSRKTKSDLPAKTRRSLNVLDLKPKKNPKAGVAPRLQSIKDGTSNTMMGKTG